MERTPNRRKPSELLMNQYKQSSPTVQQVYNHQMFPACESLEALVAAADGGMYKAKQQGKNCVFIVATPAPQDAPL